MDHGFERGREIAPDVELKGFSIFIHMKHEGLVYNNIILSLLPFLPNVPNAIFYRV